jgi:hypothetical protein
MSTDHMPKPPGQPTVQATESAAQSETVAPAGQADAAKAQPFDIGADIARVIEEQIDIIVQRQVYHTQLMFGVGGLGTDPVNARNAALTIAQALRDKTTENVTYTLANLGDAQMSQINDHTTPFNFNQQVAGLLEGILVDTVSQAYKGNPMRQHEARTMLEQLFIDANEQMEARPKSSLVFQLASAGTNARKLLT